MSSRGAANTRVIVIIRSVVLVTTLVSGISPPLRRLFLLNPLQVLTKSVKAAFPILAVTLDPFGHFTQRF
jgi:hypothetical protein